MNEIVSRRAVVPPEFKGSRLDRAAAEIWNEFSRSRIRQWIESGELTLDGRTAKPKHKLTGGEQLAVDATLVAVSEAGPEAIPLNVVHADDDLFVIDKPAGLVVHPGAGNPRGTLLNALLALDASLEVVPRAGLVHRLDKDTSGLLVVARNIVAQQQLAGMIERREVSRVYRAVCQTVLTGGGVVDAPIGRSSRDRTRMTVREGGRPSVTRYRVLERFRAQTCIELELETGRTHQIRVHMAHIRAPVVGDPVYGGRPRLPPKPTDALRVALQRFSRQALHACGLSFRHPADGAELRFTSPLPDDIEALLEALRDDVAASAA